MAMPKSSQTLCGVHGFFVLSIIKAIYMGHAQLVFFISKGYVGNLDSLKKPPVFHNVCCLHHEAPHHFWFSVCLLTWSTRHLMHLRHSLLSLGVLIITTVLNLNSLAIRTFLIYLKLMDCTVTVHWWKTDPRKLCCSSCGLGTGKCEVFTASALGLVSMLTQIVLSVQLLWMITTLLMYLRANFESSNP